METKKIELGFGVTIETRETDYCKIHNLKNSGESARALGVRIK